MSLGITVAEAISRASVLREQLRVQGRVDSETLHSEGTDVHHAVCRLLVQDCEGDAEKVLRESRALRASLQECVIPYDELDESGDLQRTLLFVEWRALRILCRSQESMQCEAEYRGLLEDALQAEVLDLTCGLIEGAAPDRMEIITRSGPETVFQALLHLHRRGEATPQIVATRAGELYAALAHSRSSLPEDMREFLLSEAARVLAGVLRGSATPTELSKWLDISSAHAQLDVDPEPQEARIEFSRMVLCHEQGFHRRICRIAPTLQKRFTEMAMHEDSAKCRIVWAASLKMLGRFEDALAVLQPLKGTAAQIRRSLYGWVLLHSGDLHQLCGNPDRALEELLEAGRLLHEERQYTGLADVKSMISCIYRARGRLEEAVGLLRSSEQEHEQLGMKSLVANNRILIAETYLAMGRPREAEIEIRAALPMLEEQGMLADAVIAVNLLREAVRQRKLQPVDIRDSFKPKA